MRRALNGIAAWFGTLSGFGITQSSNILFLAAGALMHWSDRWMNAYTLFLSIAAFVMAGIILVANQRSEKAIQAKLDEVIRSIDKADDKLVGIEHEL